MSCCAAGTESAAELETLKSEAPSPEETLLSSRTLGNNMRQVDLIVPGVHCGACIALLERELALESGSAELVRGHRSRSKQVRLPLERDELLARLEALG